MLNEPLAADPMPIFAQWMEHAWQHAQTPNPNAMALTSVAQEHQQAYPSTRVVLMKDLNVEQGYVVFHTNYQSRKGQELLKNPRANALFFWDTLGQQVRLEGNVTKSPEAESDAYFASRNRESQIGAWTSAQSEAIDSRQQLADKLTKTQQRFADVEKAVPRPPHWGGFRLWIERIELWCNGEHRLHDRAVWQRDLPTLDSHGNPNDRASIWTNGRLQP